MKEYTDTFCELMECRVTYRQVYVFSAKAPNSHFPDCFPCGAPKTPGVTVLGRDSKENYSLVQLSEWLNTI